MASTGSGSGVIYAAKDYSRYRLMFTTGHVSRARPPGMRAHANDGHRRAQEIAAQWYLGLVW
jgi:hypothetical protein